MKSNLQTYFHPISQDPIVGRQLERGDQLLPTDVYASASGRWVRCPCPGLTLGIDPTVVMWIRVYELPRYED